MGTGTTGNTGDETQEKKEISNEGVSQKQESTSQTPETTPQVRALSERQQLWKAVNEWSEMKKEIQRKVRGAINSKSGYRGTVKWHIDNLTDRFLYKLFKMVDDSQNMAEGIAASQSGTLQKLDELKAEINYTMNLNVENIVALVQKMTENEGFLTLESFAELEVYSSKLLLTIGSPSMAPLSKHFKEIIATNAFTETQEKVMQDAVFSRDNATRDVATGILTLIKESAKEKFTKNIIDKYPERALIFLLKGNTQGVYSAVEMQQYFQYALDKYAGNSDSVYQTARAKFEERMGNFKTESEGYQACYIEVQNIIKERVESLGIKGYGHNFSDIANPASIGKLAAGVIADTALVGNFLANRPMLQEVYQKEGLFSAIKSFVTIPWNGAAIATKVALHRDKSNEPLLGGLIDGEEKKEVERRKEAKALLDSVREDPTWGVFVVNGGVLAITEYAKFLQRPGQDQQEPTIQSFQSFLKEKEKATDITSGEITATRGALDEEVVFNPAFSAEQTANLKRLMAVLKQNNIQTQSDFNKKIDEAGQTV